MKNYYDAVREVMLKWPQTRDDDLLLWGQFLFIKGHVKTDEKFYAVLGSAKKRKLPSFESISRARRKVQEKEPALRGSRYNQRKKEETEYHDYYREN